MKSLEEQFCDQAKGCCCAVYFYAVVFAIIAGLIILVPVLAKLP